MLGFGVIVNYFDRVNLSVASIPLGAEFHLTSQQTGWLLGAYAWTYLALQVPSGDLLDRFGVKLVGRITTLLWSVASFFTGIARGLAGLIGARLLLGIAEAPSFPGNAKAIGMWFPRSERGLATAIFDASAKFANGIGVTLVAILLKYAGWRVSFYVTGILSFLYFVLFWKVYKSPSEDRELSESERMHISQGGAETESGQISRSASLWYLLRRKKVWGVALGMMAYNYNFYLFVTWLPGYLNASLRLNVLESGLYAAIPWMAATAADLVVGGWLVDHLVRKGFNATRIRQTILVAGLMFGLAVIGAARTTDARIAIFWISIALSGLAASAPVGWSVPGLIAPPGSIARVGGIMNFCGNLPAILAPVITGYLVGQSRSFERAFLVAAGMLIVGITSYVFLLGKIEPIPAPQEEMP